MKDYREIYNTLSGSVSSAWMSHNYPTSTEALLREAGIDARGYDSIQTTQSALFVYMAWKIKELEEKIDRLST